MRGLTEGPGAGGRKTRINLCRILSQTLDESGWIEGTIIAFDLVANLMTSSDRAFIEHNLFRSMIRTIYRNNAGESNWQSWHNCAMNAVGVSFNDSSMIDYALNSPDSGMQYNYSLTFRIHFSITKFLDG